MLAVVAHRRGRRLAQVGPVAGRPRCVLTVLCTVAVLAELGQRCSRSVLSRQGGQRCSRSVLSRQRLAELPAQVVAHLGLPGALLLVRLSLLRLRRVRCRWRRSWPNGGLRGVLGGLGTTFTMRDAA